MKFVPGSFVRMKHKRSWPESYSKVVMWMLGAGICEMDVPTGALDISDVAIIITTRIVDGGDESLILCKRSIGWVYSSQLEEA